MMYRTLPPAATTSTLLQARVVTTSIRHLAKAAMTSILLQVRASRVTQKIIQDAVEIEKEFGGNDSGGTRQEEMG